MYQQSLFMYRWIPDGQLCPTVPNRSNYIHWINDLLSSEVIQSLGGEVKGFDIGTGANCIYPLLGASLFGWRFVASGFFFFFFYHSSFALRIYVLNLVPMLFCTQILLLLL